MIKYKFEIEVREVVGDWAVASKKYLQFIIDGSPTHGTGITIVAALLAPANMPTRNERNAQLAIEADATQQLIINWRWLRYVGGEAKHDIS